MRRNPVRATLLLATVLAAVPLAPTASAAAEATAVTWTRCDTAELAGFECATLTVPRDWSGRVDGTFRLAVVRHRSTGTASQRVGSLFFNPGGPGGSGLGTMPQLWSMMPTAMRQRFDLVTWDPRGVGASDPELSDCGAGSMTLPATGPVDWTAAYDRLRATTAAANAACAAKHGDVLPYLATNAVVRDLDALRAAVGDARLTYWGASYGSRIGYDYALTFPDRVRAMLLDGSVNPNGTFQDFVTGYSTAADSALGVFFQLYPRARADWAVVAAALERAPLTLTDGSAFTRWNARDVLEFAARSEASWPQLAASVKAMRTAATATGAAKAAALKALAGLPRMESYDAAAGQVAAVNCVDYADRPTVAEQDAAAALARVRAPISGWRNYALLGVECTGLDLPADPVPVDFGQSATTHVMLVGTTRDAATPYVWTAAMGLAFKNARTVTYTGGQHVVYLAAGSACVNAYVQTFFVWGKQPAHDVACPNVGTH